MSKPREPKPESLKSFFAPVGQVIEPEFLDDDYPDIVAITQEFEAHWMQSRQGKEE